MVEMWLFLFLFIHLVLLFFFTAFLGLRLDSVIDWNWGPIFLPLFTSHVLSIIRSCWRIGDVTDIHFFKCGQFVSTVLLIVFEIMLCIALNLHEHNQLETNYLIITLKALMKYQKKEENCFEITLDSD